MLKDDQEHFQYLLKDHLGNTAVMFSDVNNDGALTESSIPADNEIFKRDFYYPFGLQMEGNWQPSMADPKLRYLYNGKEKDAGEWVV